MARNFFYDAFAADKADKFALPPVTNAERISNLRRSIEMNLRCLARATSTEEAARIQSSIDVRERNLAILLGDKIGAAA